jgi:hypothetical protein
MTTELHTVQVDGAILALEITPTSIISVSGNATVIRRAVLTVAATPEGANPFSTLADYSGTVTAKYEREFGVSWTSDEILINLADMAGFNVRPWDIDEA